MARVIRSGQAPAVPVVLRDARAEAERIVAAAHEHAARLRDERLDELAREARDDANASLAAARLEVERARRAVLDDAESAIATLALAAARRLLGEELELRPERVRTVVREALDRVRRATRARVRVHPEDAAQLLTLDAEVVPDPAIERGGCLVESELGEVDARLEVRLDALARALANARRT